MWIGDPCCYPDVPKNIAADPAKPITDHTPVWKNILLRNITATDAKLSVRIVGLAEQKVENVTLQNVDVTSDDVPCQIIHAEGVKLVDSKVTSTVGKASEIVDATIIGLP